VPHTWGTMPDYAYYDGLAWYRRHFAITAVARDAHVRLRFDAAFYLARVWLNGHYLGQHAGGYTPFEFDVSKVAEAGGENVVAVVVDNRRSTDRIPATIKPAWSFDWWNYGGLVRDVSLLLTSRVFIGRQQIIATPHLIGPDEADTATVTTTLTLRGLYPDEPIFWHVGWPEGGPGPGARCHPRGLARQGGHHFRVRLRTALEQVLGAGDLLS